MTTISQTAGRSFRPSSSGGFFATLAHAAYALFDRLEHGVELGYGEDDVKRGRELKAAAMAKQDLVLQDIAATGHRS